MADGGRSGRMLASAGGDDGGSGTSRALTVAAWVWFPSPATVMAGTAEGGSWTSFGTERKGGRRRTAA